MIRLMGPGLLGTVMFLVWVYAVFDVIATDSVLARNLPKATWVLIVLFIPGIGALSWLMLGRPLYVGWRPGDTSTRRPTKRVLGPEDQTGWGERSWTHGRPPMAPAEPPQSDEESPAARERRLAEWEADLQRRERESDSDD